MEYESVFAWFVWHLWHGLTATAIFHFVFWFAKMGRWSTIWTGRDR